MTGRESISEFISQRTLALVGVSRGGKKFGSAVYRELKSKGYKIYLVHPDAQAIGGERCWPSLRSLPEPVDGAVIVVPPSQTEKVVEDAYEAGIRRVWMQQGAESPKAVAYCEAKGIQVVHGECILMFAEPVGFLHRVHRWLWRVLGKLPK
jgi:hypothetical protein